MYKKMKNSKKIKILNKMINLELLLMENKNLNKTKIFK
jgi:hypothetical protein